VVRDIGVLAGLVGVPGLIIFFLSGWRDRRKEKEQRQREDKRKQEEMDNRFKNRERPAKPTPKQ
jgi:hypothetical protein